VPDALEAIRSYILWIISNLTLTGIVDILVIAVLFYGLLYLIRGTQAVQLLRGTLLLVLAIVLLSNVFQLTAINFLIRSSISAMLIAIPVIFQPELRRALERLGRAGRFFGWTTSEALTNPVIEHITRAAEELSERRHGALIVLERETGLQDIADTGMALDAAVSADLLLTIFFPKTELHDGAALIRHDRIVAARCILPLADRPVMEGHLGTRHMAALGLTERTDAIVIVVSEETGIISVARSGRMVRNLDKGRLSRMLYHWFQPQFIERFPRVFRRSAAEDEVSTPVGAPLTSVGVKVERVSQPESE